MSEKAIEAIPFSDSAAAPPAQRALSREETELLKDLLFKGASDLELRAFIQVCNRKQLDPFSRQIYALKRWDAVLKREIMTYQLSIDGLRLTAERTGKYMGQDPPLWCGNDGKWVDVWLDRTRPPAAAKVGVYREGFLKPIVATAGYHEYVQLTREGVPNSIWLKRPAGQLAKCAESLALRQAFPEELSNLYSTEEMGQADNLPGELAPAAAKPADPAPPVEIEPAPEAVLMMWSRMTSIASVCQVFGELKTWLKEMLGDAGEAEYYRILKQYGGVEHANQLKQRAARTTCQKLWEAVQRAEMVRAEPGPAESRPETDEQTS